MAKADEKDLQQELLEAQKQLLELRPEAPTKPKPYTREEIKDLKTKGHLIGAPNQRLSEGHDEEDLQEWEEWLCELELKDIGAIPETGDKHSVPAWITPMKRTKPGMRANDKTFQQRNKQINFRYAGVGKPLVYAIPKDALKASERYECHYFIDEVRDLVGGTQKEVRLLVKACTRITGAPDKK